VLAPELARDERFRLRFLRESLIAASLEHPNVVATLAARRGGRRLLPRVGAHEHTPRSS
jgi:hypothetical protein